MRHSIPMLQAALCVAAFVGLSTPVRAQIILIQNQTPAALVQEILLGQGIEADSITFNGNAGMAPVGVGPSEIGRFNGSRSNLGLDAGIFLCTGVAEFHIPGPNTDLRPGVGGIGAPGGISTPDQDLSLLIGSPYWEQGRNIYNKAVLEFNLVPDNDLLSFRYVFSSEEYERWACSEYNDAFGWFISGPGIPTDVNGPFSRDAMNIAFIPGSLKPVCINAVNSGRMDVSNANGPDWTASFGPCFAADSNWRANAQYYRYNGGQWPFPQAAQGQQLEAPYNEDPYYIAHNGLTVVLTATAAVEIGQRYHMKLAVSNVSDSQYGSAVFIEQNSFRASDRFTLTVDEAPNVDLSGTTPVLYQSATQPVRLRINRWGGFYLDEEVQLTVEGDAVAGVDYLPPLPESVHFDQLDSAVVITLELPVGNDPSELLVTLTSGNGNKMQHFPIAIEEAITTGIERQASPTLAVYPNPANGTLHVELPAGMRDMAELELLDMAGRVVRSLRTTAAQRATLDLGDLPDGLYTVKATVPGRVVTARVNVRH